MRRCIVYASTRAKTLARRKQTAKQCLEQSLFRVQAARVKLGSRIQKLETRAKTNLNEVTSRTRTTLRQARTRVGARVRRCVRVCVRACVCLFVCMLVCMPARKYAGAYVHAYVPWHERVNTKVLVDALVHEVVPPPYVSLRPCFTCVAFGGLPGGHQCAGHTEPCGGVDQEDDRQAHHW